MPATVVQSIEALVSICRGMEWLSIFSFLLIAFCSHRFRSVGFRSNIVCLMFFAALNLLVRSKERYGFIECLLQRRKSSQKQRD